MFVLAEYVPRVIIEFDPKKLRDKESRCHEGQDHNQPGAMHTEVGQNVFTHNSRPFNTFI